MICFNFYFDKQSVKDILREIVTTSKVALTNTSIITNTLCPLQVVRLDPFHAVSPTLALYTATVADWDTVTLACPSLNKVMIIAYFVYKLLLGSAFLHPI